METVEQFVLPQSDDGSSLANVALGLMTGRF
jgi:hypothetical protein